MSKKYTTPLAIGLLLGLAIKGQDLLKGAKAKSFTERIKQWGLDPVRQKGPIPDTITIGSVRFYIFFGNDDNAGPAGRKMNSIMVVCKDSGCNSAFTDDEIHYIIEALDTTIDGYADPEELLA